MLMLATSAVAPAVHASLDSPHERRGVDPDIVVRRHRRQTRQNPVIWVLFGFFILLLVPIQVFTPLKPPYQEADTWAQIIATLMVALAFDANLNTSWLMPTREE